MTAFSKNFLSSSSWNSIMALTPLTGSTSYATPTQFLDRYDVRTVGDLLSDTDTSLTASEVLTSTRLQAILDQASGDVETACVAGRRYVPDDLDALIANGGNSAHYLIGLVCDLAMYKIMNRRPSPVATAPPGPAQTALDALQLLRGGERILGFEEAATAGVRVQFINQNRCSITNQAARYFGYPLCGTCDSNSCGGC